MVPLKRVGKGRVERVTGATYCIYKIFVKKQANCIESHRSPEKSAPRFGHYLFEHSNLFRVSCFEFRILFQYKFRAPYFSC
jgi:hypothetical protein